MACSSLAATQHIDAGRLRWRLALRLTSAACVSYSMPSYFCHFRNAYCRVPGFCTGRKGQAGNGTSITFSPNCHPDSTAKQG